MAKKDLLRTCVEQNYVILLLIAYVEISKLEFKLLNVQER